MKRMMVYLLISIFWVNTAMIAMEGLKVDKTEIKEIEFCKAGATLFFGWTLLGLGGFTSNCIFQYQLLGEKDSQQTKQLLRKIKISRAGRRLGITPLVSIVTGAYLTSMGEMFGNSYMLKKGLTGAGTAVFMPFKAMVEFPAECYADYQVKVQSQKMARERASSLNVIEKIESE